MKSDRHNLIMNLIENNSIETQDELCARLKEAGYNVTQATVSRDIRELKLTKVVGPDGRQIYAGYHKNVTSQADSRRHKRLFKDAVKKVDVAVNLLVIKTNEGMAPAVGAAIDALGIPGMVGCIAGDDTIMCAMHSYEEAVSAMDFIERML